MAGKRTYNITSLQRGLNLLHLFADSQKGMSASRIAKLSASPMSTVHRFFMNLTSAGYVNCDCDVDYHLGIACVSVGQAALSQLDLRRLSLPYLQELNRRARETLHLTVRFGLSAVYVEKLDSSEPLRIHSRIGAAIPLFCTAVGKVLLAYLPEQEQATVLDRIEMHRFTANTVGSPQELQTQLQLVRRNGYACDLEEHQAHIRCVAAPIWDHTGAVNASLTVTGPAVRMGVARLRQLGPLTRDVGLLISRDSGYPNSSRIQETRPTISTAARRASALPNHLHSRRKTLLKDARK
ncbi:MAG: IclR family transcriptional regulator [Candidatus Acidiferrales bacterium]